MAERSHLSIGEVLSLLREEFPDVTISKIRFLESQGLVDPERTPSGYRKFYDHDVERLRWILRQQREHFLPLKVIRGRLGDGGVDPDADEFIEPEAVLTAPPAAAAAGERRPTASSPRSRAQTPPRTPSLFADKPSPPPPPARTGAAKAATGRGPSRGSSDEEPTPAGPTLAGPTTSSRSAPARAERAGGTAARSNRPAQPLDTDDETDSYTAEELATSAGAAPSLVVELEQFGLISARAVVAGVPYFDDIALTVTRNAAEFARHGVEVRHLRSWRNAADRETDLFQQIVMPLLRQRNPQARRQAAETLAELARLGGELRSALVGRAVRDIR